MSNETYETGELARRQAGLLPGVVPWGGDAGQVLTKKTGSDYDYGWHPPAGGSGDTVPTINMDYSQNLTNFNNSVQPPTPCVVAGLPIPAGSLIVVIAAEDANAPGGSVADSSGNVYTPLMTLSPNNVAANGFVRVWYCNNCKQLQVPGGITYTPAGGGNFGIQVLSLSGQNETTPFDPAVTNSAVGSADHVTLSAAGPAGNNNEVFIKLLMVSGADIDNWFNHMTFGQNPLEAVIFFNAPAPNTWRVLGALFLGSGTVSFTTGDGSNGGAPFAAAILGVTS
jgi:hypothetical protein